MKENNMEDKVRFTSTDKKGGVHFSIELENNTSKTLCGAKGTMTSTDTPIFTTCEKCQKLMTQELWDESYKKIRADMLYWKNYREKQLNERENTK